MGISTEGSQDLRRKCFSHEHTVLGEAKAQLQCRQAKAHGVPQKCRRREMLCTAIRKGNNWWSWLCLFLCIVRCVLSYANGCLLRAAQCSCVPYPLWFLVTQVLPICLTNTSIKFTFILKLFEVIYKQTKPLSVLSMQKSSPPGIDSLPMNNPVPVEWALRGRTCATSQVFWQAMKHWKYRSLWTKKVLLLIKNSKPLFVVWKQKSTRVWRHISEFCAVVFNPKLLLR